jgi:hypothetical protein
MVVADQNAHALVTSSSRDSHFMVVVAPDGGHRRAA